MTTSRPPMDPHSSEATDEQLALARAQGEAYGLALAHMTDAVAHDGGERVAGDYRIGYAVEEAEGMYAWSDGELVWREPDSENAHIEVTVRDAADGRFVPGVRVFVTLVRPSGEEIGTHEHPLLWHPMLYHYGRNWTLPEDGEHTLRVQVEPPTFMRHDEVNGRRFLEPVEIEFTGLHVNRGQG